MMIVLTRSALDIRAGVIGLTTALILSRGDNNDEVEEGERRGRGRKEYEITVAAKYMPGDFDVEYASPWAGANYLPLVINMNIVTHVVFVILFLIREVAKIDSDLFSRGFGEFRL